MPKLTDRQTEFVHHLVTSGCTPTEAARAAGYAEPKQEAYRLTRLAHVQDAIRQERERLISAHGANVAVVTIVEILKDKAAPASARVSAARTMLEVAGHFDKNERVSDKALNSLTADELVSMIGKLDEQLSELTPSDAVH